MLTAQKEFSVDHSEILEEITHLNAKFEKISKDRNTKENIWLELLAHLKSKLKCDGGTIYTVSQEKCQFKVYFNESLNIEPTFADANLLKSTSIPLFKNETKNLQNICTYAIHQNKAVNIKNVYEETNFDFSGTKAFDQANNYQTKSVLAVPITDYKCDVIGVIQVINSFNDYFSEMDEVYLSHISIWIKDYFSSSN